MAVAGAVGLHGKLPAHGDFVRRRLPSDFVAAWDAWLSAGLRAAREAAGGAADAAAWDARWDAAPALRFAAAPGVFGAAAARGVVAPSADSVGRRFACVAAAPLPAGASEPPEAWYAALEAALAAAREGRLDADALLARLPAPPEDPAAPPLDAAACCLWRGGEDAAWPHPAAPARLAAVLRAAAGGAAP